MEGGESFAYAKDSNENLFTFAIGVTKNSNRQISVKKAEFEIRLIFCIIYSCLTNISFKIN